jgi:hypothetical protein
LGPRLESIGFLNFWSESCFIDSLEGVHTFKMQNMVYHHDPAYQHYQHQLQQEQHLSQQPMSHFDMQLHNYAMTQNAQLLNMPPAKPNETKPRLGKDEVDILEREFRENPKPTTKVKQKFAREMGVELPRINVCIRTFTLVYPD